MTHRGMFSVSALTAALVAMPAYGQLFSDVDGSAANWTSSDTGGTVVDIRFGFDYGNYDIYGDGYITGSIGEAPSTTSGAATTGIFVSANNDSFQFPPFDGSATSGEATAAAVFANGVNVGAGTANPNFKMSVDIFHSVSLGYDYDDGNGTLQRGTTNYVMAGALYETPTIEVQALNDGTDPGGISVATTGEAGSGSDWYSIIDGKTYSYDGATPDPTGTQYLGIQSGLATAYIAEAFEDAGFAYDIVRDNTDNASALSPLPNDAANFDDADPATYRQYFFENFPVHSDPLHYTVNDNGGPSANDTNSAGQVYNQWATHEISVVDDVYYYSINDIPIMQLAINDDENDPDRTIYDDITAAGTIMLGFWDRFASINKDPEGGNFAVFDNIVVESLNSGDAPFDMLAYLAAEGYIPSATGGIEGDYDDGGQVEQTDLDFVLSNWGDTDISDVTGWVNFPGGGAFDGLVDQNELDGVLLNWGSTSAPDFSGSNVPEPTSLAVLAGLGALALRRRSA